uniref:Link domain-containing protein n=1 Tax=Anguilla anguilla TaxID=7936 RepID=A0A0E9X4X3_ANGAN
MEKICFMSCLFLSLAVVVLPLKYSKIRVHTMPVLGVFEVAFMPVPNTMSYGFNASQAREVCESLNVAIASKKQVEKAHRSGLQTCRFGWTDEQIAVIPRINPSTACGQNRTGLIIWRASVTTLFDVFCFNSTALEIHLDATTSVEQAPGTSSSSPSTPFVRLPQSTHWTPFISPSLSPSMPPARLHQPVRPQPMSSTESSFGVVPAAVIITAVTVLLLIAFAALWRYRKSKNSIPLWKRESRKDCTETEVWKSTCEKKMNQAESEEERDRKNSNVSPSVDPETQTESV